MSELVQKYFSQLTIGCGRKPCSNKNCASNPSFKRLNNNEAAGLALKLAKERASLCENQKSTTTMMEQGNDDNGDDELIDFYEDDDNDVIVPSSSASSRAGSAMNSANELKSMNDALNDAVKFVTQMEQKRVESDASSSKTQTASTSAAANSSTSSKTNIYLNERRVENLIKRCKENVARSREAAGWLV